MDEGWLAGAMLDSPKSVRDEATGEKDPPDAAASLLAQLLERLGRLDPPVCLRWVGELLSQASQALSASGDEGKPLRLVGAGRRVYKTGGRSLPGVRVPGAALSNSTSVCVLAAGSAGSATKRGLLGRCAS